MNTQVRFSLTKEGYVVNYLTTEAVTEPFVAPHTNKNQLKFEAEMREVLPQKVIDAPKSGTLGEESQLGAVWKYYAQNRNTYIDFSKFYFTLTRVNPACADAACQRYAAAGACANLVICND